MREDARARLKEEAEQVTQMAIWLARVTVQANRFPVASGETVRDSLARPRQPTAGRGAKRRRPPEPAVDERLESPDAAATAEQLFKLPRLAALCQQVLARAAAEAR